MREKVPRDRDRGRETERLGAIQREGTVRERRRERESTLTICVL